MNNEVIIDAHDAVLGRLASYAAKQSLLGKTLIIVNCNTVRITGNRRSVIDEWRHASRRGGASLRGPFLPRKDTGRMVKRTIRGMLSYKQQRGLDALKRIKCYGTTPAEYQAAKKISLASQTPSRTTTLAELSREI